MKSTTIPYQETSIKNQMDIVNFYNEATEDYEFWSKDYNMHFGYFIPFRTSLFRRDTMLNEMNNQVVNRLNIKKGKGLLIDLGYGMGASMRYSLKKNKDLYAFGVTLSSFQVSKGNELLKGLNGTILKENYNHTSFKNNSFESALAIESFCHSGHNEQSIREAYRILKPEGKLVIADAFLKKPEENLSSSGRLSYKKLCNHWNLEKLETIKNMVSKLKSQGFTNIQAEDASFRVAPSVLHVPFAVLGFVLKSMFSSNILKRESLHNLKGSFYALFSGLHMKGFGYYIITCTKTELK